MEVCSVWCVGTSLFSTVSKKRWQVTGTPRPPMRLKVPESRKRKVPEPPSNPPEVWERVIDASRNAVYYWEHRTKRSSWDVPPACFGWWERLRTEHSNMEFFWNSATYLGLLLNVLGVRGVTTETQKIHHSSLVTIWK